MQYRRHADQISTAKFATQQMYADQIRIKQLIENLGFVADEIPYSLHLRLMKRENLEPELSSLLNAWIEKLIAKNSVSHYYDEILLRHFLTSLMKDCLSESGTGNIEKTIAPAVR